MHLYPHLNLYTYPTNIHNVPLRIFCGVYYCFETQITTFEVNKSRTIDIRILHIGSMLSKVFSKEVRLDNNGKCFKREQLLKDRSNALIFWIFFFQIWDNALNLSIMKFHCNLWYYYQ